MSILADCHSDWCEVIPHCSFDFYFSQNERCWSSFHVFLGHLYVFFRGMSVRVFHIIYIYIYTYVCMYVCMYVCTCIYVYIYIILLIYLFLTVPSLPCCASFSLVVANRDYSPTVACRLPLHGFSCCQAQWLQHVVSVVEAPRL